MTVSEFINKVGFKVDQNSVNDVNSTINDIKNTATKVLGAIGIGISLSSLNSIAEEFNQINDRINGIVDAEEDASEVQESILEAANACKTSYSDMASSVESLVNANSDLFPIEDATMFAEYVQKIGLNAGYSSSEISSMQNTLQKIMSAGAASASDITTMLNSTPALAKQIANALGVTTDSLSALADAGELSAETIKSAILGATDDIDLAFDQLDYSISDAMLNIRNQWGFWVDSINSSLEITQTLAKTLTKGFNSIMSVLNTVKDKLIAFNDALGGGNSLFKLLAFTAGAFVAVLAWPKLIAGVKSFVSALGTINKALGLNNLGVLALVAVIVLLALIVEDFVNFMQGNDSVIGYCFQQAGIDAEEMRDKIVNIWNNLKSFFGGIWSSIKAIFSPVIDWIKEKLEDVFGEDTFAGLGNGMAGVIDTLEKFTAALAENEGLQDTIAKIAVAIAGVVVAVKAVGGVTGIFGTFGSALSKVAGIAGKTGSTSSSSKGISGAITSFFSGFANMKISQVLKGIVNLGIIVVGITAIAAALMAVAPYMAQLTDAESILEVLAVITAVGVIGAALAELAGTVGKISITTVLKGLANIALSLAAMALVSTILMGMSTSLAELSDPASIAEVLAVIAAVAIVGTVLAALAGVIGAIPFTTVINGLADIAIAIGGFAAIATAFGALSQIPGFDDLLSSGLDDLAELANGLGRFVGNLIGGIGEGITDALPGIGENLSEFTDNLQPFFDACSNADLDSVSTFFDAFTSFMLKLTANDILSIFTGGTDFTELGTSLSEFAKGITDFFDVVSEIPAEGFTKATMLFESLSGMGNLIKSGGIVQFVTGEVDFNKVANGLKDLSSTGVTDFYDMVALLPEETFDKATKLFTSLSGMGDLIRTGGIAQFVTGEVDFDKISTGLADLASTGVVNFYGMVAELPEETFTKAQSLFESLSGMGDLIKTGGIAQFVTGEVDFEMISSGLADLASDGVTDFYAMVADLPEETFTKAESLFASLSGMGDLMKSGGIAQFFTGETDFEKLSQGLADLASEGVTNFYDIVAGLPEETFTKAEALFESLSGMGDVMKTGGIAGFFEGETDFAKVTSALTNLASEGVINFYDTVAELPEETFTKATALFDSLSNMGDVMKTGGIAGFFEGEADYDKVTSALQDLAGDGVVAFYDMVSELPEDTFEKATALFDSLSNMGDVMKSGGVSQWWSGTSDYGEITESLGQLASDGVKSFYSMVAELPEDTFDKAEDLFDSLDGMGDVMKSGGVKQWFSGESDYSKISSALGEMASTGVSSFFEMVADLPTDTFTKAQSLFDSLSGMGDVLRTGGVSQFFTGETDFGKVRDALNTLSGYGVSKFFDMVGDISNNMFTKATTMFETLSGMGSVMKTGGVAQLITGEADYEKLGEALQILVDNGVFDFFDKVGDISKDSFENATTLFQTLSDISKIPLGEISVDSVDGGTFIVLANDVHEFFEILDTIDLAALVAITNSLEEFVNMIKQTGSTVSDTFNDISKNVSASVIVTDTSVEDSWESIEDNTDGTFQRVRNSVQNGMENARDTVISICESINTSTANAFSGLPSIFKSIGLGMMEGMAEGISSGTSTVTETLSSALSSMETLVSASAVSMSTQAAAIGTAIDNSTSISQNVSISNTFNGEKAAQQKAATAINAASADITSTLSRALAYAR